MLRIALEYRRLTKDIAEILYRNVLLDHLLMSMNGDAKCVGFGLQSEPSAYSVVLCTLFINHAAYATKNVGILQTRRTQAAGVPSIVFGRCYRHVGGYVRPGMSCAPSLNPSGRPANSRIIRVRQWDSRSAASR